MRTFLYHKDATQGRIFEGEEEIRAAINDGWLEAPWLVNEAKDEAPKRGRRKSTESTEEATEETKEEA